MRHRGDQSPIGHSSFRVVDPKSLLSIQLALTSFRRHLSCGTFIQSYQDAWSYFFHLCRLDWLARTEVLLISCYQQYYLCCCIHFFRTRSCDSLSMPFQFLTHQLQWESCKCKSANVMQMLCKCYANVMQMSCTCYANV